MAADANDMHKIGRMHPEDRQWFFEQLREFFQAAAQGPALPLPGRPPVSLDALDSQQFDRLKDSLLTDITKVVREATHDFLPEEDIEERIAAVTATIDRRLESFKSSFVEEVQKIVRAEIDKFRGELFEVFDDIDLPLAKEGDKRKKTAERIRGMIAIVDGSKEFKKELWGQFRTSLVAWIVGILMTLVSVFGFRGGQSH